MRVGLLSDIHGNTEALVAVLESAQRQEVERILCSGDIVGYYYEPHRCLDLLSEWELDCIRGNHEDMLFRLMDDSSLGEGLRRRYGSGLSIASNLLTPEQRDYLAYLPAQKSIKIQDKTLLLCHGAPWDTNQYIYPDADDEIFRRCAKYGFDYVVLGHTHYQLAKRCGPTFIINPGSVGQPKGSRHGVAHWAILDMSTGWHKHLSAEYDTSAVIAQAKKYDPDVTYLQSILARNEEQ